MRMPLVMSALLLAACAGNSAAQSLGDVARQQRTTRKPVASRTITNDDLPRLSASTVNVVGAPAAEPETNGGEQPADKPASLPDTATQTEKAKAPVTVRRNAEKPAALKYTVAWAAIPGVMNAAVFRFTMPELAAKDGIVPPSKVEIISNPCTVGKPADPSPQLYASHTFHIFLRCPGLTKGTQTVGLARLIAELSPPVKAPGHYTVKGALGYYAYHSAATFEGGSGTTELRYLTTGEVDIEPINTPHSP